MPREKKLMLLLLSCICLQPFSVGGISFGSCPKMLCIAFFISEFQWSREYFQELKGTLPGRLMVLMVLATCLTIIFSKNAHNPSTAVALIINELIAKYLVFAYVFVALSEEDDFEKFYKVVYYGILILTTFGLLNLVTRHSIIADITGGVGNKVAEYDRVRVVSLFTYPFDYGFCCCVLSLFALYGYRTQWLTKSKFIQILSCSFIGVLICGCRTVVVVEAIMLLTYYLLSYEMSRGIMITAAAILIGIIAYSTVPYFQNKIDVTATAFDADNEDMNQSSIYMRGLQMATVQKLIKGHELTGRGYLFFLKDLGYNKNGNSVRDLPVQYRSLMGMEGVGMGLLLERGYLGLGFYLLFYGGLIYYAWKLRRYARIESACAISVLLGFVCYGNMTGELNSAIITMFFSGMYLKLAVLEKEAEEEEDEEEEVDGEEIEEEVMEI